MFSLAYPTALLALTGLLVPLAIHLWNRRPGRVVPVGTLRWLTPGANRRMRQLHLTQWPLLLLRLTLLGLLALALAGPRWQQAPPPLRPQVLISPEALATPAFAVLRPGIDSLRRAGAELRLLQLGFPLLSDSLTLPAGKLVAPSATANQPAPDWLWSRAAEAADSFPHRPLHLYTTAELRHFGGSRPVLPAQVRWHLLPARADSSSWLQAAARPTPDSLRLVLGSGNGSRVGLRTISRPWPAQLPALLRIAGLPPLQLRQQGREFSISPEADSSTSQQPTVPVQKPLRVGIYVDAKSRAEDLRYVRAALRATAPAYLGGLQLSVSSTAPSTDSLDWIFWLADAPIPAQVQQRLARGTHLLRDAPGIGQAATTHFAAGPHAAQPVELRRRAAATASVAAVLWRDATGQPVLTFEPTGLGGAYQLHTRFHPHWSSLPTDGQLPAMLLHLLTPASASSSADNRLLDPAQVLATTAATAPAAPQTAAPWLDLRPWVALAAGLLFVLERLFAGRRRSLAAPAA